MTLAMTPTEMTATAYPLTWPKQFARAKSPEAGRFKTTLPSALKNVQDSLRLFAADSGKKLEGLVISSNVTLGEQRPYADASREGWLSPEDAEKLREAALNALAFVRWMHFGKCRTTGLAGMPPAPAEMEVMLKAALAATKTGEQDE